MFCLKTFSKWFEPIFREYTLVNFFWATEEAHSDIVLSEIDAVVLM